MQSSGFLAPPTVPDTRTDKQKLLWSTAYTRIERFLPGFLNEVIPTPVIPAPPAPSTTDAAPEMSTEAEKVVTVEEA